MRNTCCRWAQLKRNTTSLVYLIWIYFNAMIGQNCIWSRRAKLFDAEGQNYLMPKGKIIWSRRANLSEAEGQNYLKPKGKFIWSRRAKLYEAEGLIRCRRAYYSMPKGKFRANRAQIESLVNWSRNGKLYFLKSAVCWSLCLFKCIPRPAHGDSIYIFFLSLLSAITSTPVPKLKAILSFSSTTWLLEAQSILFIFIFVFSSMLTGVFNHPLWSPCGLLSCGSILAFVLLWLDLFIPTPLWLRHFILCNPANTITVWIFWIYLNFQSHRPLFVTAVLCALGILV